MQENKPKASRRGFFMTASVVGAAAAAVSLVKTPTPTPAAVAELPKPAPEKGGGYSESAHVLRYYQTTRV